MRTANKQRLRKVLAPVLGLLLGAALGYSVPPWLFRVLDHPSLLAIEAAALALVAVFAVLAFTVSTLLHEGGHLLAGLLTGYRFVSFRLFSLMLIRREGRLRFCRYRLAGTAGQCLMAPPAWTERGIPTQLYNWGGVAMNLLLCAAVLPRVLSGPQDTAPGAFCLALLAVNAYMALVNGLPLFSGDGGNAVRLRGDLRAQRAFWQSLTVNALMAEGRAEKDLPPELFSQPEETDLTNPILASSAYAAAEYAFARGRLDEAEEALAALLQNKEADLHPAQRFLAQNDLLFLRLKRLGAPDAEVEAFGRDKTYIRLKKSMAKHPPVIRTAWAEAVLARDDARAAELEADLERVAKTWPYPQEIEAEWALMIAFRAQAADHNLSSGAES